MLCYLTKSNIKQATEKDAKFPKMAIFLVFTVEIVEFYREY